jgi:hypothetical protein
MQQIIDGTLYDTKTADLVASGPYPKSHGWARGDRGAFLYKTKDGAFFLYRLSMWVGEPDSIEVMSVDKAREWYKRLSQHERGYKETFGAAPGEA